MYTLIYKNVAIHVYTDDRLPWFLVNPSGGHRGAQTYACSTVTGCKRMVSRILAGNPPYRVASVVEVLK